jgi:hypothetical protein
VRAQEFVTEMRQGKLSTRHQSATVGLNVFSDSEKANSDYTLNRVMMAAAMADGSNEAIKMNGKSWVGKTRTAHPYTKVEQNMLKQAFKAAGANWQDLNHGDLDSEEVESTNTQSPLRGFKGYPR